MIHRVAQAAPSDALQSFRQAEHVRLRVIGAACRQRAPASALTGNPQPIWEKRSLIGQIVADGLAHGAEDFDLLIGGELVEAIRVKGVGLVGEQDTGFHQIAVFAAQRCHRRDTLTAIKPIFPPAGSGNMPRSGSFTSSRCALGK